MMFPFLCTRIWREPVSTVYELEMEKARKKIEKRNTLHFFPKLKCVVDFRTSVGK